MIKLTVTTASELALEQREKVEATFSKKLGDKVSAQYLIDETILGGIIVFDGEKVYDGSVKTKLDNIKSEIIK